MGLHVLVVEDELLIRWSIVETLTTGGATVLEASDAATAVTVLAAADQPVDAVILDFRLPDSNDLTLLATIRRLSPESAVVMMTAFGTPEVVRQARALGAHRVIDKPFNMHDLGVVLAEACAARYR